MPALLYSSPQNLLLTSPIAARTMYAYPPSPHDSDDDYPPAHAATLPSSARLRFLQQELANLEAELAKTNAISSDKESQKDAGQMIEGLKDVKSRLEMIGKTRGKEGRERLVEAIQSGVLRDGGLGHSRGASVGGRKDEREREREKEITELDRRLGELEKLVGSSSAALDEVSLGGSCTVVFDCLYIVGSRSHRHCRHHYYQCSLDSTPN
jgi:nuclear migration protein JNM1